MSRCASRSAFATSAGVVGVRTRGTSCPFASTGSSVRHVAAVGFDRDELQAAAREDLLVRDPLVLVAPVEAGLVGGSSIRLWRKARLL